jgi:coronin-1B/1C/6
LATCSADCSTKLWVVPEGGLNGIVEEAAQELNGHSRKVGTVKWNPVAENVLATTSADFNVKVWDAGTGSDVCTISGHTNLMTSCEWNYNGSLLATACKDKHIRVVDPRANQIVHDHDRGNAQGTKGNKVLWQGKHEKIISFGFGPSQREYCVYDTRNMSEAWLSPVRLDSNAGSLIGYYDNDVDILFLGGKGDGTINYYEFDNETDEPKKAVFHLNSYTSNTPQAGLCFMPKRGCDAQDNELARGFKIESTQCSPLRFMVPRRSEGFSDDLFPHTASDEPALTAEQWFSGENSDPILIDLSQGYSASVKDSSFQKSERGGEIDDGRPKTLNDFKAAYEELTARVAFLEAEVQRLGGSS